MYVDPQLIADLITEDPNQFKRRGETALADANEFQLGFSKDFTGLERWIASGS
jgi:hypothetical protein